LTGLYFLITSSMPKYLQSTKLSKVLTELHYLHFLRSIIQQHLTITTAYIPDYIETITLSARTFVPRKSADFRATRRSWITRSPGIPKFALRLPKHNGTKTARVARILAPFFYTFQHGQHCPFPLWTTLSIPPMDNIVHGQHCPWTTLSIHTIVRMIRCEHFMQNIQHYRYNIWNI